VRSGLDWPDSAADGTRLALTPQRRLVGEAGLWATSGEDLVDLSKRERQKGLAVAHCTVCFNFLVWERINPAQIVNHITANAQFLQVITPTLHILLVQRVANVGLERCTPKKR
jgi:hypothetical protein